MFEGGGVGGRVFCFEHLPKGDVMKKLIEWWREFDQPPRSDRISVCMVVGMILFFGVLLGIFDQPKVIRKGVPPPPAGCYYQVVKDGWTYPPGWELKNGVWFPTDGGNPVAPSLPTGPRPPTGPKPPDLD